MEVVKFNPSKLPVFVYGEEKQIQISIEGTTNSFKFSFTPSGSVPEGVSIGAGGLLIVGSNTPVGTYELFIDATEDGTGNVITKKY